MIVDVRVLGPIGVVIDGREVELRSARQLTLLAVLIVHAGRPVSTGALIRALWQDSPPAAARSTLHAHVSRLRGLLATQGAAGCLRTEAAGYALDVDARQVDAAIFEQRVHDARSLIARDSAAALAGFDGALALWRGPAYAEVSEHGPVRTEAARLEQVRVGAVDDRVDVLLALGRHAEVLPDLEQTVARHPLRERPYGQLMLARYRDGRAVEALQAFRQLRSMLAEEFGLDPSPALQRLEGEILRRSRALVAPVPPSPTPPRGPPAGSNSFVGRDAALAELARLMARARLVTLTGAGGAGKSRLAVELADRVAERFPDGVRILELAPVREGRAVVDTVATQLGVLRQGSTPLVDTVMAALRPRRTLLLIDNCEHVLGEVARLVDRLVRECPRTSVLATSRQRLAVRGENLWPVAPLAVPPEGCAARGGVEQVASVELFCDRAVAADPAFRLDDDTGVPVAHICRRLDGLPLAIELAAARVTALHPADLARRLDARFGVLTGGPRDDTGRHRTLRATIDWSYQLLDPEEAALFARLSVFRGGFDLAAAEAVCGPAAGSTDTAGVLATLVDKSMVVADRSGPGSRFRMLETLRDHAAERLEDRGETRDVKQAHAEYFVCLAESADRDIRAHDEARGVALIDRELPNLRAAQRWAVAAGDADLALRLSAAVHFYAIHRLRDEVLGWAVGAAELPSASGHPLLASVYASAAFGAAHRGELATAHELVDRGTAVATDGPGRADVLETVAAVAIYEGRLADSRRHGTEAAEVARRCGDAYRAQWSSHVAALAATYAGDPDGSQLTEAVTVGARALGNPSQLAWAAYLQGEAMLHRDPGRAVEVLDSAIALATPVGNQFVRGVALVSACSARGRTADPHAAIRPFRETVDHWSRAGDWTHQWTTLRNLVEVLTRVGADEAAAVVLAATATASSAPPVYGVGAERLARAESLVRARLGADRFARARERGRRMEDDQIVVFALDVLGGLERTHSSARAGCGVPEQLVDEPRDQTAAVEPVAEVSERPELAADEFADRPREPDGGLDHRVGETP